jgi:hypothetical protein
MYRESLLGQALALSELRRVERTADATCAVAQDVGIDHRRGDVAVAQELLHGSDVVSTFEQRRSKGMAEGVTRHSLPHPRCLRGIGHGSLNDRLVQMMPPLFPFAILPSPGGRKDPMQLPVAISRAPSPSSIERCASAPARWCGRRSTRRWIHYARMRGLRGWWGRCTRTSRAKMRFSMSLRLTQLS